jgi:hypothetical protein
MADKPTEPSTNEKAPPEDQKVSTEMTSTQTPPPQTDAGKPTGGLNDSVPKDTIGDNISASEPKPEDLQEKKVKMAFLERFKLSKKDKSAEKTPQEINTQPPSTESVAKELYKQIADIKDEEYITFRFRKKSFLLLLGFLVALMWLYPLGRHGAQQVAEGGIGSLWSKPAESEISQGSTDATYPYRVRIRNHNVSDEEAEKMQSLFIEEGFAFVEVVPDPESEYDGVTIITKAQGATVRELITGLLAETYSLASPSAELTDDSDFDAVILLAYESEASESAQLSE